jgi:hypothetical protein
MILTLAERKEVSDEFQRRNLANCQRGLSSCAPLLLKEEDLNAARAAFRSRNVEACKRGLPACDPSLLTGPEMASVVLLVFMALS